MKFGKDADPELPDHLFRWLDAARDRLSLELGAHLPPGFSAIGGRRGRLLQLLPAQGMRITDLAERAGVTKQALGQLVTRLEQMGLVESLPDPADRRVRRVRRTPEGDQVCADLQRAILSAQQALRADVGPERFDTMLEALRDISVDPTDATGPDAPTTTPP